MRDTFDLTPPQRTPVIRGTATGRATAGAAEQSIFNGIPLPFEAGAQQSWAHWIHPFEAGAEQSYFYHNPAMPFEDGAEQSFGPEAGCWPFEDDAVQSFFMGYFHPFEDDAVQSYDRLYPPFEHGGAEQSLHGNPWDPFE